MKYPKYDPSTTLPTRILLVCMWLLVVPCLNAQEDTIPSFNALRYSMQQRYRQQGAPFENKHFGDHLYIGVYGGMEKIVPRGNTNFDMGAVVGVRVGKNFTPVHGAAVDLWMGSHKRDFGKSLKRYGVGIDHHFNLTAYFNGYQPNRFFELSTVEGIGYQYSSLESNNKHVADLHFGLQFKLRASSHFDIAIRPQIALATDGIDHSFQENWRRYDIVYGIGVGLNYRIRPDRSTVTYREDPDFLAGTFFSISSGVRLQTSSLTNEIGLLNSAGPSATIAIGKWLTPVWGLRLSATQSSDTWRKVDIQADETTGLKEYERYLCSSYLGGRVEALIDPLQMLKSNQEESRFHLHLLAGGEFGNLRKQHDEGSLKRSYSGFTAGLQVGYELQPGLRLFAEPRFTAASYSLPTESGNLAFTDNLLGMELGVVLTRPSFARRAELSLAEHPFRKHLFLSLEGGMNVPLQQKKFAQKRYIDYQGSLTAGYRFTPVSAAQGVFDFNRISADMYSGYRQFNLASVGIDYVWNVTNLFQGYDPDRKMEVELFAGPVVSYRLHATTNRLAVDEWYHNEEKYPDDFFIGGEVGMRLNTRISRKLDVTLSPKIRIYGKDLLPQADISGNDYLVSLQAGLSYRF